jgi:DNA-binding LytR/AlgR family response regulator
MKNRTILIIEDDPILALKLKILLESQHFHVLPVYHSGEHVLKDINQIFFDLAIVDIKLKGELSGIDTVKKIKEIDASRKIIFLTAWSDLKTFSEIDSFEYDCYIRKPYDDSTLLVNIRLALRDREQNEERNQFSGIKEKEFLSLEDGGKAYRIPISQILYFKSEGNYVNIYSNNFATIVVRRKLTYFEEQIKGHFFLKTHNRYLVNFSNVVSIGKNELFIGEIKIPISMSHQKSLRELFLKH